MIGLKSCLKVIDNTGAVIVECVRVLHGGTHARIGDSIAVVVQKARPIAQIVGRSANTATTKVRRGDMRHALVVRTKKETQRPDGKTVRFDDNACVLINDKGEPLGTRVLGIVALELRNRGFAKIASLAPKVV